MARESDEATTLYVAIEIFRQSWVAGIKSPLRAEISSRTPSVMNVAGLMGQFNQYRSRVEGR